HQGKGALGSRALKPNPPFLRRRVSPTGASSSSGGKNAPTTPGSETGAASSSGLAPTERQAPTGPAPAEPWADEALPGQMGDPNRRVVPFPSDDVKIPLAIAMAIQGYRARTYSLANPAPAVQQQLEPLQTQTQQEQAGQTAQGLVTVQAPAIQLH
ncbi:unnamed protein product, partial [Amoebophrya sp. A25]